MLLSFIAAVRPSQSQRASWWDLTFFFLDLRLSRTGYLDCNDKFLDPAPALAKRVVRYLGVMRDLLVSRRHARVVGVGSSTDRFQRKTPTKKRAQTLGLFLKNIKDELRRDGAPSDRVIMFHAVMYYCS